MDGLIETMNKLQEVFATFGAPANISLPQLVVVGSQSAGKSSVLENIVGRDFLPRGTGIVTRRPLILQLNQTRPGAQEYGEFTHKPGQKFTDFNEIREEIVADTERIAGGNCGISEQAIILKIYSPHVLTLTLVDLPGVVRVAVGNQPRDIPETVKKMILSYIQQPNSIILAVSPANADIATSDAIQYAKQVDPTGERTLGVLTKIDIMDRGTNAMEVLEGHALPLKLGYIGVKNRSQAEINAGKSIRDGLESEEEYFRSHPEYSRIAGRMGTKHLTQVLSQLLHAHIREAMPALRAKISDMLKNAEMLQKRYGGDQLAQPNSSILLQQIKLYSETVLHLLDGTEPDMPHDQLWGGARIKYVFFEGFAPFVNRITSTNALTDDLLRTARQNVEGTNYGILPSNRVFDLLVRNQIQRLEEPSLRCIGFSFDELRNIVDQAGAKFERYPVLKAAMLDTAKRLLVVLRGPTESHVKHMLEAERGFINGDHPEAQALFQNIMQGPAPPAAGAGAKAPVQAAPKAPVRSGDNFQSIPAKLQPSSLMTDNEVRNHEVLRLLVEGYFCIVKRTVADQVPKAVMHFMVEALKSRIHAELTKDLYKPEKVDALLKEADDVVNRRNAANKMVEALNRAQETLNGVMNHRTV